MMKSTPYQKPKRYKSQATLGVIGAMMLVMVEIGLLISTVSLTQYQNQRKAIIASQALLLADSGVEEALYRLHLDATYNGGTVSLTSGDVDITITNVDTWTRTVSAVSSNIDVYRKVDATVSVTKPVNPLESLAIFGGEDVELVKSNAVLEGNLWSNDNVDLDNSTIVYGNVYSAGQGNGSKTQITGSAQILDNPSTVEVEGNVFSIDRVDIVNGGSVAGDVTSTKSIKVNSGGSVSGSQIIDTGLAVDTITIPTFDFDSMKQQAQTDGTYYTSPAQFITYLSLNSNTVTGGVHYIESSGSLVLPDTDSYDITGSIITEGDISIQALDYVHNPENNLPVIAAQGDIEFVDQNSCNCHADITGVVYSAGNVVMKHDHYNGPGSVSVLITGTVWGADEVSLEDYSKIVFDPSVIADIQGFNFGSSGGGSIDPSVNNTVFITNWDID